MHELNRSEHQMTSTDTQHNESMQDDLVLPEIQQMREAAEELIEAVKRREDRFEERLEEIAEELRELLRCVRLSGGEA